jgi:hypothetical protein
MIACHKINGLWNHPVRIFRSGSRDYFWRKENLERERIRKDKKKKEKGGRRKGKKFPLYP